MKKLAAVVVLLAAAVSVSACGGSNSTADTVATKRIYPWLKGPSREFLVPGGDNVVPTYGEEGTPKERAEATAVIAAWLRVRAAKNWKKDCSYFSRLYAKGLAEDAHGVTHGKVDSCPEALAYFKGNASGNFVDNLSGSIDSLRVGEGQKLNGKFGEFAYAQYHGNDGKDWVVPLERDGDRWGVAKAGPIQSQH